MKAANHQSNIVDQRTPRAAGRLHAGGSSFAAIVGAALLIAILILAAATGYAFGWWA